MNSMRVKGTIVAMVFACVAGGIFIGGCAKGQVGFARPTEKKVSVIELKNDVGRQELLQGKPQTYGMRSGRVHLRAGESIGQHSTKGNEEIIVFISGNGAALIGQEESMFEVGQGKVCYIPPQTIHNIKNTGTEPLVYIYCVAPTR